MSGNRGAIPPTDVAVVGGGPAGTAAAITLARTGLRTTLLEASTYEAPRLGEILPPRASEILTRLAVPIQSQAAAGAALPCYGIASAWASTEIDRRSFLFDAHGYGWHLDRRRFDLALAEAARAQGVAVLTGQTVARCARDADGEWRITLPDGATLRAAAVIDATGRAARIARLLGGRRRLLDHLIAIAVRYRSCHPVETYLLVEAEPDGWWYSAPLPGDELIVVFMTDADLGRRHGLPDRGAWNRRLAATQHTRARVGEFAAVTDPVVTAAVSQRLEHGEHPGRWLATGDAALAVDPLSSSGIVRALTTGETAGQIMYHCLLGRRQALVDYERWLDNEFAGYTRERQKSYSLVARWPGAPFWRRRVEGARDP
jgi:flavin-dependent dehydrogenase